MGAHTRENQDQRISVNPIDQKPIRFNMAFAEPSIFPRQPMVLISSIVQDFLHRLVKGSVALILLRVF